MDIFFPEETRNDALAALKNDGVHQYVWGGCYLNTTTGFIDKVYSKNKDEVYTIHYEPQYRDAYVLSYVDRHYNIINFGVMKKDFTKYQELEYGGGFLLKGIKQSMQIIFEQQQQQKAADPDGWFN